MKRCRLTDHNWLAISIHNRFFEEIREKLTGRVVDLGSGFQPYREDVIAKGCSYIGVDWSKSLHAAKPDVFADLNEGVGLNDEYADVVMSFSVLEHLYRPERLIVEAYRLLRPGGYLFLQVPFQWGVHEAPHDYVRFTRFGLERLLKEAGFSSISIEANTGYWVTAALKFSYHLARFVRGPRPLKWIVRACLTVIWTPAQLLALLLDTVDRDESETASYTIRAVKGVA